MKINGTTPCYFCGSKNKNGTILNHTFLNDDSKIEDERKIIIILLLCQIKHLVG